MIVAARLFGHCGQEVKYPRGGGARSLDLPRKALDRPVRLRQTTAPWHPYTR